MGFDKFKTSDATEVAEFLERRDVRLLNWYRTDKSKKGAAIAHSKVFAVEGPARQPFAVLAGSANLTNTGLGANVETMVEAVHGDRDVVFKQILALESEGYDSAAKILAKTKSKELIETSERTVYRRRPVWQEKAKPKKSARSGCLPALVPSIVWCLIPARWRGVVKRKVWMEWLKKVN